MSKRTYNMFWLAVLGFVIVILLEFAVGGLPEWAPWGAALVGAFGGVVFS